MFGPSNNIYAKYFATRKWVNMNRFEEYIEKKGLQKKRNKNFFKTKTLFVSFKI